MSTKREYRISSEDTAKPPVTIHDEPRYFAQGLKPEVNVEEKQETVEREDGEIVRRTYYNTGMVRETLLRKEDHPNVQKDVAAKKRKG